MVSRDSWADFLKTVGGTRSFLSRASTRPERHDLLQQIQGLAMSRERIILVFVTKPQA